jgi:hypothetical protein
VLKQLMRLKLFAVGLFLAASCAADGEPMDDDLAPDPEPEPPAEGVLLTDWVDSMIANEDTPDTVNDKPAIVIDVPDQEPFAKYFQR